MPLSVKTMEVQITGGLWNKGLDMCSFTEMI